MALYSIPYYRSTHLRFLSGPIRGLRPLIEKIAHGSTDESAETKMRESRNLGKESIHISKKYGVKNENSSMAGL